MAVLIPAIISGIVALIGVGVTGNPMIGVFIAGLIFLLLSGFSIAFLAFMNPTAWAFLIILIIVVIILIKKK